MGYVAWGGASRRSKSDISNQCYVLKAVTPVLADPQVHQDARSHCEESTMRRRLTRPAKRCDPRRNASKRLAGIPAGAQAAQRSTAQLSLAGARQPG
jgi:hypothetical protein